jgi:Chaperone of endosialidase
MAFLGGALGGGGDQIDKATGQAVNADWTGAQLASNSYWTGQHNALQHYIEPSYGNDYFDPYSNTGKSANTMFGNALGLNGPQGNQAATAAFQANPGYQFATQQGIQALDRSAAGSGMFGSGNAAMALNDYGQNMANQQYGNWMQGLSALNQQGMQAAVGQTGRQGALAGIEQTAADLAGQGNLQAGISAGQNLMQGGIASANANMQGGSNLLGLGGSLLSGISGLFSDRRMKTDIRKLGKEPETGLPLYAYRYKSDPKSYPKTVGPMAQDIEKRRPDLVGEIGGRKVISGNWLAEMRKAA